MSKAKYAGELNTPLRDLEELFSEARAKCGGAVLLQTLGMGPIDEIIEADMKEQVKKLFLLLDHYEIDIEKDGKHWFQLSVKLAQAHVRGLSRAHKAGAKKKWSERSRAALKIQVDDHIQKRKSKNLTCSVVDACNHLAKQSPWNSLIRRTSKAPGAALRAQYNKADDMIVEITQGVDDLDGLEKHVGK